VDHTQEQLALLVKVGKAEVIMAVQIMVWELAEALEA
jgi:hypothetical protein